MALSLWMRIPRRQPPTRDGRRSLGEIFETVRTRVGESLTQGELLQDFMAFYQPLNSFDIVLLRHRDVPPFREYPLERLA